MCCKICRLHYCNDHYCVGVPNRARQMAEIASKCSKVSKQFNIEIASINERIESSAKSGHFEIDYYVADVLDVNMRELNDKIIKSLEDDGFVVKPSDIERYGFNLQISWRPEEIT